MNQALAIMVSAGISLVALAHGAASQTEGRAADQKAVAALAPAQAMQRAAAPQASAPTAPEILPAGVSADSADPRRTVSMRRTAPAGLDSRMTVIRE